MTGPVLEAPLELLHSATGTGGLQRAGTGVEGNALTADERQHDGLIGALRHGTLAEGDRSDA